MPDNNLPTNLGYGTVVGRFLIAYSDGVDLDLFPDGEPATGNIFLTPSVKVIKNPTATPAPVTIIPATVVCALDSEGYLTGPDLNRGIRVVATNDPDGSPTDWTWTVDYELYDQMGNPLRRIPSHAIQVPEGQVTDLTLTGV